MHLRPAAAVWILAGLSFSGCSLPRGPINFDPIIPHWISHGEVSCDCRPDDRLHDAGAPVDPSGVLPPHSKFHPVPTRPVFEPPGAYHPQPLGL